MSMTITRCKYRYECTIYHLQSFASRITDILHELFGHIPINDRSQLETFICKKETYLTFRQKMQTRCIPSTHTACGNFAACVQNATNTYKELIGSYPVVNIRLIDNVPNTLLEVDQLHAFWDFCTRSIYEQPSLIDGTNTHNMSELLVRFVAEQTPI